MLRYQLVDGWSARGTSSEWFPPLVYSKLVSNCPRVSLSSFLIVRVVVLVVLVVVWVVLGVVLEQLEVVASHCCYRRLTNHPQDHQNHHQDN